VLDRQEVELTASPTDQVRFYNGSKIHIPADKTIYLTRDSAGIATAFEKEFKKLKIAAQIIDATPENIPDLPDAAGLVLIPDAFYEPGDDAVAGQFLLTAFSMASKNGPHLTASAQEGGAFMACISFLGGGFGFKNFETQISPVYGGMAGLAKTAALEWKPVLCRVLDLPFDPKAIKKNAEAAVGLMMTRGAVEMGLDSTQCYIPELVSKPVGEPVEINLDKSDVVVISGGARGVTAACAIALARQCRAKIALLGRSKPPFEEPSWLKGMNTPAQMKKAIFANAFEKEKQDGIATKRMVKLFKEQFNYKGTWNALLSTFRSYPMDNLKSYYKRVGASLIPVMFIWGAKDETVPFKGAAQVEKAIPHIKKTVIEDGTHSIVYSHPQMINKSTISFLKNKTL